MRQIIATLPLIAVYQGYYQGMVVQHRQDRRSNRSWARLQKEIVKRLEGGLGLTTQLTFKNLVVRRFSSNVCEGSAVKYSDGTLTSLAVALRAEPILLRAG